MKKTINGSMFVETMPRREIETAAEAVEIARELLKPGQTLMVTREYGPDHRRFPDGTECYNLIKTRKGAIKKMALGRIPERIKALL